MRGSFLRRRLLSSLTAVLGVSVLVFLLVHLIPGDPVDNLLGERADPIDKLEMRRCMDLDQSLVVQFGRFIKNVGNGTLGRTCPDQRRTVTSLIAEALPSTIALAGAAMFVALIFALPLGVAAALRPRSALDAGATIISLAGISMPSMWLGPLLLAIFYVGLQWLPGPADQAGLPGLILPAFMLGTHLMAMLARMTRSSLLEVLGEDYVRTARAKGLSSTVVVLRHALRNALVPVITVAGIQFGSLLAGAVVTEKVFARPGIGTLLLEAISQRDYRVVQGCTLVIAVSYVTVNLLVDLAYGLADPRIRVQ
ncbi:MAG: binding-protein-dependent transport system inner rane component [Myxococcales bacterium]|nr:binding-protein-dependent transport system inner rane component [Myxococcales bacterium]